MGGESAGGVFAGLAERRFVRAQPQGRLRT